MFGSKALILSALVAVSCGLPLGYTEEDIPQPEVLRGELDKLTGWLTEKGKGNSDVSSNLALINDHEDELTVDGLSDAVRVSKVLMDIRDCEDVEILMALRVVDLATDGRTGLADDLFRSIASKAAKKCESYQDKAYREALDELMYPAGQVVDLFKFATSDFIEAYKSRDDTHSKVDFSGAHFKLSEAAYELMAGQFAKVAASEQDNEFVSGRTDGPVDESNVDSLFRRYLAEPCEAYLEDSEMFFEMGQASARLSGGSELDFVARRSRDYQEGLFRRNFCQQLVGSVPNHVARLTSYLEHHL